MAETFALRHIAVACVLINDDRVFPCDLLANIAQTLHFSSSRTLLLLAIRRAHAQMLARASFAFFGASLASYSICMLLHFCL